VTLAESGQLDLESMVTRRMPIEHVNEAFRLMTAGEVVRSVLSF
jgi:S-(hydroxymethyl)glutathione dehydrogenase/alcohol dehydrogenase